MFDAKYFRSGLQADVDAVGGSAVVEVHLANGRVHRVRSVVETQDGYVRLEAYEARGDEAVRRPRWQEKTPDGKAPQETERAVVAYEGIVNVVIIPVRPGAGPKIGFAGQ